MTRSSIFAGTLLGFLSLSTGALADLPLPNAPIQLGVLDRPRASALGSNLYPCLRYDVGLFWNNPDSHSRFLDFSFSFTSRLSVNLFEDPASSMWLVLYFPDGTHREIIGHAFERINEILGPGNYRIEVKTGPDVARRPDGTNFGRISIRAFPAAAPPFPAVFPPESTQTQKDLTLTRGQTIQFRDGVGAILERDADVRSSIDGRECPAASEVHSKQYQEYHLRVVQDGVVLFSLGPVQTPSWPYGMEIQLERSDGSWINATQNSPQLEGGRTYKIRIGYNTPIFIPVDDAYAIFDVTIKYSQ